MFLKRVTFKDPSKQYNFEYIDPVSLCSRNSYSQDYWGYFNNEINNYFLPEITTHQAFMYSTWHGNREPNSQYSKKGLLKKIVYPTGGYNEFEYEKNTYFGNQTIYPSQVHADFNLTSCNDCMGWTVDTFYINPVYFNHEVFFNASAYLEGQGGGCNDTSIYRSALFFLYENWTEIKFSEETSPGVWIQRDQIKLYPGENEHLKAGFLTGKSYAIVIKVHKSCLYGGINFDYYDQDIQVVDTNLETGGSRIKNITAYDPVADQENETYYYYNEIGKTDTSSGDAGNKGYYISNHINRIECVFPGDYVDCEYYVLNSNSLIPLINTGNNNIYYEYVTVSHGGPDFEQGAETHHFFINRDETGCDLFQNGYVPVWSNSGWDNGLEALVKIYKNVNDQLILTKQSTNYYSNDSRNQDTVYSYNIRKIFELLTGNGPATYTCKEEDLTYYRDFITCVASHKHSFRYRNKGKECKKPDANMDTLRIEHPCYGLTVDTVISLRAMVENLRIVEYMNYSFWHYLDSTSVTDYFDDGSQIITTTKYLYDNPEHASLTRVRSINSKNELVKTTTTYPGDISDASSVFMSQQAIDSMLSWHMIGIPLKTEKSIDESTVDGQITSYGLFNNDQLLTPSSISKLAGNDYEKRIQFDEYDSQGNLIQYHDEHGIDITYLWGYNYTYPIAKIENADFATVINALVGISYTELQSKSSEELIVIFSNLRSHNDMQSAMIHSYTYSPLVGMTSQTSPNGITTTFNYDDYGRLKDVLDHDSLILNHYDYNYQQYNLELSTNSIIFDVTAGSETVSVVSDGSWIVTESADWLSITPPASGSNNGNFTVNCTENTAPAERTSQVSVSVGSNIESIEVTQSAIPYLEVSPDFVGCGAAGEVFTISVTSNVSWQVVPGATWVSVENINDNGFQLNVAPYTGEYPVRDTQIQVTGPGVETVFIDVVQYDN